MYSIVRTTDATVEPVTLDQAKAQCRVTNDVDDDFITALITAARQHCERRTNRAFIEQTWRLSLDSFPWLRPGMPRDSYRGFGWVGSPWSQLIAGNAILLPMPNLMSVVSLKYLDQTGTLQTLDPSLYLVDTDSVPARICPVYGTFWPYGALPQPGAVQITYTAGYGASAANVPQTIQQAILGTIAAWYENREATVLTNSSNAVTRIPDFVDELLAGESVLAFTYEN